MNYEPIIGLEVHAQLLTDSKIFCRCSTKFGGPQNSQVCPVCLGMPGVLPVLNRKAVEYAVKMGLAMNCRIAEHSIFARKNYFYPDLPKGYQISQYEEPLCEDGWIEIELEDGSWKRIGIIRVHLEEDAGKSVHAEEYVSANETLVDLNRCGTPLIEIVSGPDIHSPREAYLYLTRIRQLVRYLGICDGNMEEGSLRCDANISVRPAGQQKFGTKTELKNMNSFRNVERALEFEINRHIQLLEAGGTIVQQTLLWDAAKGEIVPMRSKEYAHDYRYFPEPDLVPLRLDEKWRKEIHASLPELPLARRNRFIAQYGLPKYDADVLTDEQAVADYFESTARLVKDAKLVSNWIMGEVLRVLKEKKIDITQFPVMPAALAELLNLITEGTISSKTAKEVFDEMVAAGRSAKDIVTEKGLVQVSDIGVIEKAVDEVIAANPKEVERYRNGEEKLFGFLVGQVMKHTRGKANPKMVNEILQKRLRNE
ncbi:MAG: Asp-tRNA(Asn)/Glu-tRNA(Gln) amidotransferase subunit GatB [candidate division KSB1 bacterium]|nr:Asp-tRNA(Asn)/Glu-tRNA(Gln) amidotransferase subunit GatB [candidate division KSB1 bacterium]MDZ7303126.1 Asp-tRNA(Asn)/Glu-tRNA(Gln) amidotransferase subunit GatB [candidate division KSB1 bacterium]MDZ7310107.1 Asp-tRNA(Asn)/Glu-tRNA(Gln) amidotransferase subunit GatB [candidate division KSB1 bacterium]